MGCHNLDLSIPSGRGRGVASELLEASSSLISHSSMVKPRNGLAGSPRPGELTRDPDVHQVHGHVPTLIYVGPTCVHGSTSSCSSTRRARSRCPRRTSCSLWGEQCWLGTCTRHRPPLFFLKKYNPLAVQIPQKYGQGRR